MRGQMRNLDKGQDEKAGVLSQKADVLATGLRRPADKTVASTQMAGCRGPGEHRERTALRGGQILEVLPDRLGVTQVVVVFKQAVE